MTTLFLSLVCSDPLRTVTPFVLGRSGVSFGYFFLLNSLSALVWSAAVGTGGYLFGNFLKLIMGDIRRYEFESFCAIASIGGLIWGFIFIVPEERRFLRRIESIKVEKAGFEVLGRRSVAPGQYLPRILDAHPLYHLAEVRGCLPSCFLGGMAHYFKV